MVQHILNDVDPGVLKTTLVNFFIYGISSCYTSVNWDAISSEAYFRQLIDLGACSSGISTTCRSATTPRQAGSRRSQEEVKNARKKPTRARTQKSSASRSGSAAFRAFPAKGNAWGARQTRGTPPAALEKTTHSIQQKAPSPGRETVLLHARRCYDPLPDACAGAVTSVRVTPLEKVRLLRMAEKSLDMLR